MKKKSICILYTGGTIGMVEEPETGTLIPLGIENITTYLPELVRFDCQISFLSVGKPVDSSEMNPERWNELVRCLTSCYADYDGFVILHGTDTMAYTASALSFMIEGLSKPIILTGSQLPLGRLRTDAKENLISAIEIATYCSSFSHQLAEVCVFFGSRLMRGNRTHKYSTEHFDGIISANYPPLAEAGVRIKYNSRHFQSSDGSQFRVRYLRPVVIATIRIFPGTSSRVIGSICATEGLEALILETYGSGNIPTEAALFDAISAAKSRGVFIANVSQCSKGFVDQGLYKTGLFLRNAGVSGSADMTIETVVAKIMFLFSKSGDLAEIEKDFVTPLRGEMTTRSNLF